MKKVEFSKGKHTSFLNIHGAFHNARFYTNPKTRGLTRLETSARLGDIEACFGTSECMMIYVVLSPVDAPKTVDTV